MTAPREYETLRERVLEAVEGGIEAASLDRLLLEVFAFQHARNPVYRRYCDRSGATPGRVSDWTDIPAVPTTAFRVAPLVCGSPEEAVAIFRTSGTTGGADRRGTHHLLDLKPYHAALLAGFRTHLLPDGARLPTLSFVPDSRHAPDSSLGHMADRVAREHGASDERFARPDGSLDVDGAIDRLERAEAEEAPVCVLATAFSLVHLLDALEENELEIALPARSRIMETGGFKGRSREVDRASLYEEVRTRLGVPEAWVVNEYGMTELGSQFYDAVAGSGGPVEERRHRGPEWTRTRAMDPVTLDPLPAGEPGILRHWDPINLGSVAVVQTEDLGAVEEDGSIRLLGRLEGAEPRGCSLALEEVRRAVEGG